MFREYVIRQELERLRREQDTGRERPALELPLPIPYWPEPEKEDRDADESRGVIIIDMEDYVEVDV